MACGDSDGTPIDAGTADARVVDGAVDSAVDAPPDAMIDAMIDAAEPVEFPQDCAEARQGHPASADGDYTLYVEGASTKPWTAYCYGMQAAEPIAYMPMPAGTAYAEVIVDSNAARTDYARIRIDARTLVFDLDDARFATTSNPATLPLPAGQSHIPLGWAQIETTVAYSGPVARSILNLRGTTFIVVPTAPDFCLDTISGNSSGSYYARDALSDIVAVGANNTVAGGKTRVLLKCAQMKALANGTPTPLTLALQYSEP
jgi:hypothetical protein